ncbi:uncharacterized protein B0H64DRAFT_444151 [Chaetomium fimeti]|uniref:Uncharacterized protein n=1 Tax=Chaetomium fimeti TaxID=1854472 RepID=A0AAE0LPP9_9PEZI|nr:hypothetical protein B0H64DRAFT_444151 [Chaetomium fimeti]
MAKCCLEMLEEAERDAYQALRWQLEIFCPGIESGGEGLESILDALVSQLENNTENAEVVSPHPNLLESLIICSAVLDKRSPGAGRNPKNRTLALVSKERVGRYTDTHHLALATDLELAFNCLEEGADDNSLDDTEQPDVAKLFRGISLRCERSLGPNHILTWRARLGCLFTSNSMDPVRERPIFRREVSTIMNEQVVLMGECHPLVLDSRWRLFAFNLLVYRDEDAHQMGSQLLDSLRLKEIRQQRMMESLQLEEKVARIYALELTDHEHALPIITDILE